MYKSNYTAKKVTAAQYLAELVCEYQANSKNIDLPDRFWSKPQWQNIYRRQLQLAHGLLKLYDEKQLVRVIRSNRIFSLAAVFLPKLIEKDAREETKQYILEYVEVKEAPPIPRGKGLKEKLDG